MQIALPLDAFVTTDMSLVVRFNSPLIVLDDLAALVSFTQEVLSAVEHEIALQINEQIEFLPEVAIAAGSIVLKLKLKGSKWSADLQVKVAEIFMATVLVAFPTAAGQPPKPSAAQPSEQCVAMVSSAVEKANETWRYFGKGFESELEVSCGPAKVTYKVKNPPRRS